jgi:ribose/xylose/arabinose/galactoside ABC-type transport system permease subunit
MGFREIIFHDIKEVFNIEGILLVIANIGVFIAFSIEVPTFATISNIYVIFDFLSVLGIAALAELIVLVGGEIDVSVPMQMAMVAVVTALCSSYKIPTAASLIIAFLIVVLIGCVNGFFTAYIQLPSFLVTLATNALLQGVAIILTRYSSLPIMDMKVLELFYRTSIAGLRINLVWFIVIVAIVAFILKYTRFGRRAYAIGGNPFAPWSLGIDTRKNKLELFLVVSMLSAVAGLILGARAESARADMVTAYLLPAIAAPVLGGASLTGGYGSVIRTILAALVLQQLTVGVYALGVEPAMYLVLQGIALIIILTIRIALQYRLYKK